jgi:D-citramalate synthase
VSSPSQIGEYFGEVVGRFPKAHFDFHGHNDYGMATANSLAAVQSGAKGVHCTVNGLGERAGNAPLDETCAALRDFGGVRIRVREKELKPVSHIVEIYSGQRIAPNKPICGDKVFTQTAGIHADGDKKGRLYETRLSPDRFGRSRAYALGKLSGRANLEFNLRRLGIELKPEQFQRVLQRVVELGDLKKSPTTDDLPFIIADVLRVPETRVFEIENCAIISSKGLQPCATARIRYKNQEYETAGVGDGGYDAFMNALRSLADKFERPIPKLVDYEVRIPPGGQTSALVESTITWANGLQTRGVSSDQVMAAIEATETMMNIVQQTGQKSGSKKKRRRGDRRKKE